MKRISFIGTALSGPLAGRPGGRPVTNWIVFNADSTPMIGNQ